ncbi:hypothetical protein ACOMHN_018433 [Nucella lapillus]
MRRRGHSRYERPQLKNYHLKITQPIRTPEIKYGPRIWTYDTRCADNSDAEVDRDGEAVWRTRAQDIVPPWCPPCPRHLLHHTPPDAWGTRAPGPSATVHTAGVTAIWGHHEVYN